jgi:hypothetical protein
VFSGPDQVQVGSNTEPDLIVMNIGPKGDPGAAATIAVGTTTTLAPGSSATVANAGTSSAAVFNFGIPTGATGATGASGGSSTAWRYRAKTNATSGYPTNGHLLWNNATQTSATEILVSHLDDEGTDIELLLSFFAQGQKIFIQNRDDSSQNQVWEITGTPTVTGANTSTAYYTFPVTLVSSAGGAFTNNHSILFGSIAAAVNAVTSATTSDGTASLDISNLTLSQAITSGLQTKMTFTANPTAVGDGQQIIWQWYNGGSPITTAAITTEATGSTSDKLLFKTSFGGSVGTSLDLTYTLATFSGSISSLGESYRSTSTFTYAAGVAATHRTALGLTTLATTTPAANVATFLETPSSANLAAAVTDETGSGSLVFATSPTIDAPTISGSAAFTSTTRPTSAGTGTPAATSLMTRDDVALEPFYNLGSIFRVSATPAFATSGTGSAASQIAGDRWIALSSGTANSGWARAQFGRGITTPPGLSGAGINFASKLGVSIILWLGNTVATDNLNIFRLRFGSDNTPVADGVDAVSYRGFGVEIKARGSTHDWRVYGHNGTSITYSAWSNTGLTTNTLQSRIYLSAMSNGAGSITASIGINGSRTLSTISTTGGATTSGTSAQAFVECHVANSASGTSTLSVALYDAIFYAQI